MIPFFRKIRKEHADDNQILKYSRYAIGEIVLVVIGILIALQINNWNEERKERLHEVKLLDNLHKEFEDNLSNLMFKDSVLKVTITNLETLFAEFGNDPKKFKGQELDSILSLALDSPTWTPSEFVLNDIKNSGNLTKLHNETLKKLLYEWSRFFSELHETQTMIESSNSDLIRYLKDHGSLRNVDVNNQSFNYEKSVLIENNNDMLNDPLFENYMDDKLFVLNRARGQFSKARALIQSILDATRPEDGN